MWVRFFFGVVLATVLPLRGSGQESGNGLAGSFLKDHPDKDSIKSASGLDTLVKNASRRMTSTCFGCQPELLSSVGHVIPAEKLSITNETDINQALAGKISGTRILSGAGSVSANIHFRGFKSFFETAPLVIVDGTPINRNERLSIRSSSVDFGINMANVQEIAILKPTVASAIFGIRGESGVILVTSKGAPASKKAGIHFTSSFLIENVYKLPDYQNKYAGGRDANPRIFSWAEGNPPEWKALDGKRYHDYESDQSWGPKMDGSEYIPWHAWYPGHQLSYKTASLKPQPDNIRALYKPGYIAQNSLRLFKQEEDYYFNIAYTNLSRAGITPNATEEGNFVTINSSFELGRGISIGGNFNSTYQNTSEDVHLENALFPLHGFHRNIAAHELRMLQNLITPTGTLASWNHPNPDENSTFSTTSFNQGIRLYNPFSYWKNLRRFRNNRRNSGNVCLEWRLSSAVALHAAYRKNAIASDSESRVSSLLANSGRQTNVISEYRTNRILHTEKNYELFGQFSGNIRSVAFRLLAGGNLRQNNDEVVNLATRGGLVVPDLYSIQNSSEPASEYSFILSKLVKSLYSLVEVNYDSIFSLHVSARNDWNSAIPFNQSSFFPSAEFGFSFQEYARRILPLVSFAKLRGGVGQSESALDPYAFHMLYNYHPASYGNNTVMTTPDILPAINPRTPKTTGIEGGIDLGFFNNRLLLGLTFYRNVKKNELIPVEASATSGFSYLIRGEGILQNQGMELHIEWSGVRTAKFNWNFSLSASKNSLRILGVGNGVTFLDDFYKNYKGSEYAGIIFSTDQYGRKMAGQITGTGIKRRNGVSVLNNDGTFQYEDNLLFGSVLPDWTGGTFQSFAYNRLTLNFSIDFQKGGKFFSPTHYFGDYLGLTARSADQNNRGKNVRDPIIDGGGVYVEGVSGSGKAVNYYVDAYTYFRQFATNKIIDNGVIDASYAKLREISVGYYFALKKRSVFDNVSVNVISRNTWLIYSSVRDIDPSHISDPLGGSSQLPSTRSYGISVTLTF